MSPETYVIERATAAERLQSLAAATARLEQDFGRWQTPWGEINRFQRITDDIFPKFDDAGPSIPIPFTSSRWGSLASFAARPYPGTKKWYGTSGNNPVRVVVDQNRMEFLFVEGEKFSVGLRLKSRRHCAVAVRGGERLDDVAARERARPPRQLA